MYNRLRTLSSLSHLSGKTVLVRIDSDVDIKDTTILDDTRLLSSLDTIHALLKHNAHVLLIGHLGRPEKQVALGEKLQMQESESLYPIASWYAHKLSGQVEEKEFQQFIGWSITPQVSLLENIRAYSGEEEHDESFVTALASLGDAYVNEAFAVSHRAHASTTGVALKLPSAAGLHLQKEVEQLSRVMENPRRPLVVLIGGAKIETKLPMVETMHHIADFVLVGGGVASHVKELIHVQHEKIQGKKSAVIVADLSESGFDITEMSAQNFAQVIQTAGTVVWNGPLGRTGKGEEDEKGTRTVAEAIVSSNAYTIVGGGDTLSYLKTHNMLEKFDFVSVGGGAMLEFLSGNNLPAITPLLE